MTRALASSTQHHQRDGPASSLGRMSMGTEQCAVVIFLKLAAVVEVHVDAVFGHGVIPVDRGNTEPTEGGGGFC